MKTQNHIRKTSIGILFLLLTLTAAFTYFTFTHATGFSDVPQSHWAYASINEASTDGVINGVGNNKFDPNGNVTLAQFTAILTRMMYPSEVDASTATGEWWAKNAEVARNHNFYEYLENTDMNHALTREEMAHIIFNAYPDRKSDPASNDAALDEALAKIPDQASLSWEYQYSVAFCYGKGILQGVDKAGNFNPKATLTRAQTAAIYVRYKNILAGNSPTETPTTPEQPTETPAEPPATVDNRDLNEWGIPHFRMLEGENVQQMMDRINAVTPPYKEGYLTNGKPITEENIKEMLDAVIEDMPDGSTWNEDNKYDYGNAKVWRTGGGGCNSYAYCVSDYIFGEDAPMNVHKDFSTLKVGDALWGRNGTTADHWVVVKEVNFNAETPYEYDISGNVNGKVSDDGGDLLTPLFDKSNPFAQYSTIWSRY